MNPGRSTLALVALLALLALLTLTGCSPQYGDAYLVALAAGQRAYHDGRYVEAARAYDEAAGKALRVKDRDEARFMQSRALGRAERWPDAEAALRRLIADSPSGPRTARAAFDIADIEIEHRDAAQGWKLLEEAADRFPNHGVARHSILRLVEHVSADSGEPAAMAFLERKAKVFRGTDQDQTITYEIARCFERMGKKTEAHDTFLAAARAHPYPFGGLTDDALYRASKIDEELGHDEEAVRHLHELLATLEKAGPPMGSYERPRYGAAQLHIAELYRDKLKDHAAARREFAKVYKEHPTSTRRDDAMWQEARLARDDGDQSEACRLANKLVKELPESRYARCARLICPTATAGERACADYIARDLGGDTRDKDKDKDE